MPTLATLLRPHTLDGFVGQEQLVGPGKPLRIAIDKQHAFSMIFWGPPGVGKTTLSRIIADAWGREFHELSAVSAGKSDIKALIDSTQQQKRLDQDYRAPVLFLDEIHRFNKAQQDFLLPHVEEGRIILIGATTENPSFEVIPALLSRSKVFVLTQLADADLATIVDRAISHFSQSNHIKLKVSAKAREWLITYVSGDARKLLNLLDQTVSLYGKITQETLESTLQSSHLRYDKDSEEHYDTISAFIKSMRASDADAALYYLARMVEAGEDPKFIARRMVIFASEDVGLAAPTALVVANAVFDAVHKIGYPEAQINLAHGVAYLCKCQKNRSAYEAYFRAVDDVKKYGNLSIPLEIRNAPTKLMKELGYGKGYEPYPKNKSLLPEKLRGKTYLQSE